MSDDAEMKAMPPHPPHLTPSPSQLVMLPPPSQRVFKGPVAGSERERQHSPSDRAEKLLSDGRRMFGSVLLCYWSFSLLRLSSALVHGNIQLDDDRRTDASYLSDIGRGHAPEPIRDPALLPADSMEDDFLMDTGSYDEDSSAALQLQGRAMRSSRRCIPHQQSCLGYPLPCCNPCDTCYCRFFNAICYCRRVGHACPPRRT